jgi:hypothetical protein
MQELRDSQEMTGRRDIPRGLGLVGVVVRTLLVIPR